MMTFTVGTGKVHSLAFAPAGDRLAVGTGACCVHLVGWPDTDNRAELRRLQTGGAVAKHLAFDPPGTRIAAAYSDGLLVEWPAEMRPAVGPALPTYRAFFPCLGLWQDDRHGWVWPVLRMHEIGVWILAGESGLAEFPERERLEQVWTNAEGGLISRSANELAIWCYATPEDPGAAWSRMHNQVRYPLDAVKFPQLRLIDRFPLGGGPWVCAARPDAATVVLADRKQFLRRLDWRTGAELACWRFPLEVIHSLAVSPDGTVAAAGSNRGRVLVWDLE